MEKNKIDVINIRKGLGLAEEYISHVYSFSIGIFFSCGSRDETKGMEGLTHFLEHMLFKGTNRRSAKELFQKIESLGGAFDAYTTKENIIIITRFLREYQADVVDIILEIMNEAAFPKDEFDKERAIILEEIKSSREDPEDRVFDLLFKVAFSPHPMSNPIIGYQSIVEVLERSTLLDHFRSFVSQPTTIAVAGNYDHESLVKRIGDLKSDTRPLFQRAEPVFNAGQIIVEPRKDISQVYVAMGTRCVPFVDPSRYTVSVISSTLGGGMSSRLFLRLRETEGLAYNIQTFNEFFSDVGLFGIFFVTDQKNLSRCLKSIRDELVGLKRNNFSKEELNIHRSLIKGNFLIGLESTTNRMLRLGRSFSQLKEIPSVSMIIDAIDGIDQEKTASLVEQLANPANYSIAVVGKANKEEVNIFFES